MLCFRVFVFLSVTGCVLEEKEHVNELCYSMVADKTKYMIMSRDQNAGRGHSMKIDNSPIERVEEFKYLGTTLTNQSSIQEEIKSTLKIRNACYYSVQNLFAF